MNIGRNDPCSCGSGKKFKKCCLLKLDEEKANNRKEVDADFELGQQRIREYEAEVKARQEMEKVDKLKMLGITFKP